MAHKVRITPEAEADLRSIGDYIAAQHAPEAEAVGADVRQMTHGLYRILYTADEQTVTIHAVRHGSRRPLPPTELPSK